MSAEPVAFGPYELFRRIGAGGMAETFVAVRRGIGRFEQRLCLKRLLPQHEHDPQFIDLFLREARISARLHHPNIAQVVDFGDVNGRHYLTLELIEGCDVRRLLRQSGGRLAPVLVAHLAFEVGQALEFAHAVDAEGRVRGVVHRDISPSNILVSRTGELKLTDFGIAKAMSESSMTRTGVIKGKIGYMAPEYAHTGHFDARSDLFSLGVTLYECLGGRRPYDGQRDVETLERARSGERTPLAQLAPHAPEPLVRIIERLIDPSPAERFADAAALLEALDDLPAPSAARRPLGELAEGTLDPRAERSAGPARSSLPFDETVGLTRAGTVVLGAGAVGPRSTADVVPAASDDATRTAFAEADSDKHQDARRITEALGSSALIERPSLSDAAQVEPGTPTRPVDRSATKR
jgi:serine/threonine protein kinase